MLRPYLLSVHSYDTTLQLHATLTCEYFDLGAVTSLSAKSPVQAGGGFMNHNTCDVCMMI